MKRTEMVDILKDKLLELYTVDYSTDERAEFMMKAIEAAGMLPPTFFDMDDGDFMPVGDVLDCANLSGQFQWEPESDSSTNERGNE